MEPAGLAVGIVGILSTFNGVVEDIRLIKVYQNFGEDYQIAYLMIQLVETRIVRWGESVGVANHHPVPETMPAFAIEKLVPEDDRPKAQQALQAIKKQLETAKNKMQELDHEEKMPAEESDKKRQSSLPRILLRGKHKDTETQNTNSNQPKNESVSTLIESFSELSVKRHKGTSTIKKAKWAMLTKGELHRLLVNIRELIEDLEALFPGTQEKFKSLAAEEVVAAQTKKLRELLQKIITESEMQDKALLSALAQGSSASVGSKDSSFNISGGSINNNHGIQTANDANFNAPVTFGGGGGGGG